MLFVKIRNAAELAWESFDSHERMVVVYAAAWTLIVVFAAGRRRELERVKRELREELTGAR